MRLIYEGDHTGANPGPVAEWTRAHIPGSNGFGMYGAIGIVGDNGIMAGIVYNEFIGRNIAVNIASVDPGWCRKGILRELFAYPFIQLRCHRMTAVVGCKNERSIKLVRGLGFRHEGTVRELFSRRNHGLVFGMLKPECRWLGEKHG